MPCQRRDHVRRVAVTIEQPVEHGCPADVLDQAQGDALFLGETVFACEDRQASVYQGQEPDGQVFAHRPPPSRLWAVTMASAISAMRLPWLIAASRISL